MSASTQTATLGTLSPLKPGGTRDLPRAIDPAVVPLARLVVAALLERKAEDVVVLDVGGRTSYCDLFVLCTGSHARHVRAIADGVIRSFKGERGVRPLGVEGLETGRWVLVDLGDVVLHIFDGPMRGYYDLDGLWMDARRVPLSELGLSETAIAATLSTAGADDDLEDDIEDLEPLDTGA